jgi:hypothetical protein
MSETVAIILSFRPEESGHFEQLFQAEVYPLWQEFKAQGKIIAASLTPVADGSDRELKAGIRDYILYVHVPSRAEHNQFDTDPRFVQFLEKVKPMQPEEPKVWLGDTLFQI